MEAPSSKSEVPPISRISGYGKIQPEYNYIDKTRTEQIDNKYIDLAINICRFDVNVIFSSFFQQALRKKTTGNEVSPFH